jgi:Icc-related predicted phosphoesterase
MITEDLNSKILIVGDIHGKWNDFNNLIEELTPDVILQVGDFGAWKDILVDKSIKNGSTRIYFCDGNHEDHIFLKNSKQEILPNIFYMKRGSVLTLSNNFNILFFGGAESIDKNLRTPGYDWFPEESITQKDLDNLPDNHIDMIISHTCPIEFRVKDVIHESSRHALSIVLKRYKPDLWVFGHWHTFIQGQHKNCRWTSLNMINYPNCCKWLKNNERRNNNDSFS